MITSWIREFTVSNLLWIWGCSVQDLLKARIASLDKEEGFADGKRAKQIACVSVHMCAEPTVAVAYAWRAGCRHFFFLPVCLFEQQQSCNEQGVKTESIEPLEKRRRSHLLLDGGLYACVSAENGRACLCSKLFNESEKPPRWSLRTIHSKMRLFRNNYRLIK